MYCSNLIYLRPIKSINLNKSLHADTCINVLVLQLLGIQLQFLNVGNAGGEEDDDLPGDEGVPLVHHAQRVRTRTGAGIKNNISQSQGYGLGGH